MHCYYKAVSFYETLFPQPSRKHVIKDSTLSLARLCTCCILIFVCYTHMGTNFPETFGPEGSLLEGSILVCSVTPVPTVPVRRMYDSMLPNP